MPTERFHVYRLDNATKLETYFGVSSDPRQRFKEHAAGKTESLEHWDWEKDQIEASRVASYDSQHLASKRAHAEESIAAMAPPPGWRVIRTAGI